MAQDFGHSTNYFTTWLRNADAASNCVTYTDCEFPNGVCNNQYGKTVFDNCTFSNAKSSLYSMWVYGGNVEVKGGSFAGARGVKVFTEGTATVAPKIAIEGTSFKGVSEKAAIVVSKPAAVTLSNVSATDCAKGLIQKAIEGSSEKVTLDANGTGIGGSFDITASTGSDATKAEFNLNAGKLTSEVSSDFLADGFTLSKSSDGTFGVAEAAPAGVAEVNGKTYPSLQEAINVASRNATVKLLADTKENVTISTPYVTLDLNGHTLNGGTEKGKPALTVTARVTVKDSSEAKTGTIMREDTAENSGVSSHYVIDIQGAGWLTFESGNVTNNSGTESGKGASLVRVGDDSVAKYPGLNIKGGNFTQNNFIVIKVDSGDLFLNGGTLNSTDSYAIENWHRATVKGGTVNGAVATWTYSGGHNSDLAISGGTINGDVKSVTYDGAEGKTAKVSITGGVVNGTLNTFDYSTGTTSNDPTKATIEVTGGTFSTDPSRYLVEGSAATQNADGTYGVEKAYLAQVGGTSYYTMDEAFKAQTASGEAITLLRDYTTGSTFNSGSIARVVDLNGHTWTCTGTDANSAAFEINHPDASLTVKNGKVVSSQLIGLIPSASGGTITYDNSTLTFEGVEATTTATSGIETNGNNTNDTVVLKDSTLNVPNGYGIYFPSSGTLTIDNSTINAKTMGAQVCSGNLNVNAGSAITVSGDPVEKAENDGAIQDGAAISIVNRPGYKGLGQIAITGGTFTAKSGNAALKAYTWDSATKQESAFDNTAKTVAVYGGTFSSAVPEALCAEGCKPIENPDGTHGVSGSVAQVGFKAFNTLQAAIDAAQDGETVTLLADATEDVAINKSVTLDLHGKTLTNTNAGKATIYVQGGTVTVKNGNVVGGTGYYNIEVTKGSNANLTLADVTATAGNNGSAMIDNHGTLTITSGTYTGGLDTVKNEPNAKLTITGGAFTLTKGTSKGFTGVVFNYGDLTINGGEFVQSDKSAPYGQAQVIHTDKSGNAAPSTVISGGTFKNLCTRNTAWTVRATNAADGATKVSGGAFNKSVEDYYCADGFIPTKNADGTYGVKEGHYVAQVDSTKYETLAKAISLAAKGKTIQLLSDATENITIASTKRITLDLNGYTLNGGTGTANAAILNKGNVTITDTSAGKTGTIKRDDQGIEGETSYYVIDNNGTMVIDQANVVNNSGIKGSSLIRNGGVDTISSLTINGGTFEQQNFIAVKNDGNGELTINGGTLTSKQAVVQNWNKAQILGGNLTGGYLWTDSYTEEGTIGETVIGGDAQFTGTIYMDVTSPNPSTLKIEGGRLNVTKWRVTDAAAAANATIEVSGGTFAAAVPADHCAAGYAPTKNADGTYGVKLAEGAYLLQNYRSGDQASWTYPTQDGKAFAGWYKDAAFKTPCTESDVEGAAYAKFVKITDLLQFQGGSLRMDVTDPGTSTYLRFGYTKAIPEGAKFVENGWYIKSVKANTSADTRFVATNNVLNNDDTITSNLVIINVPKSYYAVDFAEKAFVKYMTADGTTVEAVENAYQTRSVSEVADAILAHPMASQAEKDYAKKIKSAV